VDGPRRPRCDLQTRFAPFGFLPSSAGHRQLLLFLLVSGAAALPRDAARYSEMTLGMSLVALLSTNIASGD